MDENLLHVVLWLSYGPFALMALVFLIGLLMKGLGDATFLEWLIRQTGPQQPVKR
jgi:hypothetical protein